VSDEHTYATADELRRDREVGGTLGLPALVDHFVVDGGRQAEDPERLVVGEELPRTPSGKVKEFELRGQLRLGG
jgi:acyl-coenzyme A synthetase/AMP-(fatty) acid ligase